MSNLLETIILMTSTSNIYQNIFLAVSSFVLSLFTVPKMIQDLMTVFDHGLSYWASMVVNSLLLFLLAKVWRYLDLQYKIWKRK
jgi:hypothetical protein